MYLLESFVLVIFQTLVIYALGVVLQDSDTWSTPYRSALPTFAFQHVHRFISKWPSINYGTVVH